MRQVTLQVIRESIQPGQECLFSGRSSGHLYLRTIDRLAEEAGIQEVMRRNKLSWRKATPQSSDAAMW